MKIRTGFISRLGAGLVGLLATAVVASPAFGSSHREAPGITETPQVDGTDFYMFRSYEPGREEFITILANYVPLQDAYGGPNYFPLDPLAFYDIHISNDDDADEELTFRFRFDKKLRDLDINVDGVQQNSSLTTIGQITTKADEVANLAPVRTFTLEVLKGTIKGKGFPTNKRGKAKKGQKVVNLTNGSNLFQIPYDNVGNKAFPDYANYANSFITPIQIPDCPTNGRVFVGQRAEGFGINLGEVFDLVNITDPVDDVAGDDDKDQNDTEFKNITTFALEIHRSCLAGAGDVIGGWTTASLPRVRQLLPAKRRTFDKMYRFSKKNYQQVSRLGSPLVNELVIGINDKNFFNGTKPKADLDNFASYVTNPTLPVLLEALFSGVLFAPETPRNDLVQVFVTGVPGLTEGSGAGEMLRLNTSIAPVAKGAQNNLGVLGGDTAGFPNGRRPGDDVVDATLRVAMGALLDIEDAPSKNVPLTDGVRVSDQDFDDTFPYLRTPTPGSPNNLP